MNKQDFLDLLQVDLSDLPQEDVAQSLEFYEEMLDDCSKKLSHRSARRRRSRSVSAWNCRCRRSCVRVRRRQDD